MLDKLKDLWSRWKVHVTVVGGVLVIGSIYGTCSYEPPTVSEAEVVPAESTKTNTTVEASATTTPETTGESTTTAPTTATTTE